MIFTDFRDLHNRPDSLLGIRWALLGSLLDFKWLKKKKNSAHEIYDENTTITGTHN